MDENLCRMSHLYTHICRIISLVKKWLLLNRGHLPRCDCTPSNPSAAGSMSPVKRRLQGHSSTLGRGTAFRHLPLQNQGEKHGPQQVYRQ